MLLLQALILSQTMCFLHTRSIQPADVMEEQTTTTSESHMNQIENFFAMIFGQVPGTSDGSDFTSEMVDLKDEGKEMKEDQTFRHIDEDLVIAKKTSYDANQMDQTDEFTSRSDIHEDHIEERSDVLAARGDSLISAKESPGIEVVLRQELLDALDSTDEGRDLRIRNIIGSLRDDPLILKAKNLKFSQLVAADIYFHFLVRNVIYFVSLSLLLPLVVPLFDIFVTLLETLLT